MQYKTFFACAIIFALTACSEQETSAPDGISRAQEIAETQIIVDTHIDVPYRLNEKFVNVAEATEDGDFDYPRGHAGGLDAPFMSIYVPADHQFTNTAKTFAEGLIDMVEGLIRDNPEKFAKAHSVADVRANFERGLMSLPMGMENGAPIEGDLANLEHFYNRGIRYITLAHSRANHIADSSYDKDRPWGGLSPFGKELVVAMNNIGMMVDISHVSDETFYQVMELSQVPVIASHSGARHFTPGWERNMSDDMIQRLAQNGGVILIPFGSSFLTAEANQYSDKRREALNAYLASLGQEFDANMGSDSPEAKAFIEKYNTENPYPFANLDDVLDVIDHIVNLAGVDHVGIGSDYDGVGNSLPIGLKDVSTYPNLIDGLLERGYSEADIAKILGGNLLRVWSAVEEYAAAN